MHTHREFTSEKFCKMDSVLDDGQVDDMLRLINMEEVQVDDFLRLCEGSESTRAEADVWWNDQLCGSENMMPQATPELGTFSTEMMEKVSFAPISTVVLSFEFEGNGGNTGRFEDPSLVAQ